MVLIQRFLSWILDRHNSLPWIDFFSRRSWYILQLARIICVESWLCVCELLPRYQRALKNRLHKKNSKNVMALLCINPSFSTKIYCKITICALKNGCFVYIHLYTAQSDILYVLCVCPFGLAWFFSLQIISPAEQIDSYVHTWTKWICKQRCESDVA